jgi:hypothetical protein
MAEKQKPTFILLGLGEGVLTLDDLLGRYRQLTSNEPTLVRP